MHAHAKWRYQLSPPNKKDIKQQVGCSGFYMLIAWVAAAGDWFKVERLIKETGGDDAALANAWNKIGQYYSDRQKWAKAAQYYTQVGS
jgi:hypothetical protein